MKRNIIKKKQQGNPCRERGINEDFWKHLGRSQVAFQGRLGKAHKREDTVVCLPRILSFGNHLPCKRSWWVPDTAPRPSLLQGPIKVRPCSLATVIGSGKTQSSAPHRSPQGSPDGGENCLSPLNSRCWEDGKLKLLAAISPPPPFQ